jgi:hypothetical protein
MSKILATFYRSIQTLKSKHISSLDEPFFVQESCIKMATAKSSRHCNSLDHRGQENFITLAAFFCNNLFKTHTLIQTD